MNKDEIHQKIDDIVYKIIHLDDEYVLDGIYIRWGKVQKDLHNLIDEYEKLLAEVASDHRD